MKKYPEYKQLDLSAINKEVLAQWQSNSIFEKSLSSREEKPSYTFYEGPPSANGMPGIHHVMGRAIKDIFCRFKTLQGYKVNRKAGWDTHGLPVELGVEKELGITKEDIGMTISIEDYNKKCRENVMKFKNVWEDLTDKMGYWVDMNDPYVTYDNKYIESVWWLLSQMDKKGMLYKGHTIQPFSPKAGTGLSSHELNQPGCYKDVKDLSAIAQFKVLKEDKSDFLFYNSADEVFFLAWTTTPWTLPSNTALAVGKKIDYVVVNTFNPYTFKAITVVLAKALFSKYFPEKNKDLKILEYTGGDKSIPFEIIQEVKGSELEGLCYEQLLPYAQPEDGEAFKVLIGDFVTTEDGTGIVHLAPSFGADDNLVAKQNGIGSLTLVDTQGRFVDDVTDFAGMYVKNEFYNQGQAPDKSADIQIVIKLKEENRCFKAEKYEHSYPHCWRTDKPILYYPLESWFVKTTAAKERMVELNKSINWKPKSTGEGRFGNWLENLVDWNLSRSRFWGIPLPIWVTEYGEEQICIGSMEQLKSEIEKSMQAGLMPTNPLADFVVGDMSAENYATFDLHRPFVDDIILVSTSGKAMRRESDLIDVWFDSGSMPYAQLHYPFENKEIFEQSYPADFIAEGVDQTRGWFFTLHAIASILFDSVAFKNVVSNGLVLDKNGNKMSKRLGNAADPFETLEEYGADATRWYMISNAQPWDNLKFDLDGLAEVKRKFFGTLYNTYTFFALYANIDGFSYSEEDIPLEKRLEIDRWILSELNTLIQEVGNSLDDFEPTKAARTIQLFVNDNLSNWYVRLCRRRFWKGDYGTDKISAYQTLYTCLETVAILASPIAPFFMDKLFCDLNQATQKTKLESVHLAQWPKSKSEVIDTILEEQMRLAQDLTSMVFSLRKKENLRVRQPLQKMMVPVLNDKVKSQIEAVKDLILSEVNVKELEFMTSDSGILVKKVKPNFKTLGPKFGQQMKAISQAISQFTSEDISTIEQEESYLLNIEGSEIQIDLSDVVITTEDIPGWVVTSMNGNTVALDISLSDNLISEGLAREVINRVQNLRKDLGFEVTDRIEINLSAEDKLANAINNNLNYICSETLADEIHIIPYNSLEKVEEMELIEGVFTRIELLKR
ncbi:MAG TPA: isoleucine--tRNA ligase [Flavobacteriales bacterium]|nr:isoleucine--tRNA ligase [Flavobacteriales bacterium]